MTPSEAALEAARLIMERGLAKRILHDPETGGVCHNGAIFLAVTGSAGGHVRFVSPAKQAVINEVLDRSRMVLRKMDIPDICTPAYNDRPEVSPEDVALILKENAALEDDPEMMKLIQERRDAGVYSSSAMQPCFMFGKGTLAGMSIS